MNRDQIAQDKKTLSDTLNMLEGLHYSGLSQPVQSRFEHTRRAVMEGLEKMMARQDEAMASLEGQG